MRLVFLVLLLANLLLFAWAQGYLGVTENSREPERLARQIDPERLHIISSGTAGASATTTTAAAVATATAPEEKRTCKRISGLSADEAKSLIDAVQVRDGWQTQLIPVTAPPQHWVAITDLPNRAAAEKKQSELRQFGVVDSEIIEEAGNFAVSLGLFRDAQRADNFLKGLMAKGVRSARIQQRLNATSHAVELRAGQTDLTTTLPGLHAVLPHASLLDCSPP